MARLMISISGIRGVVGETFTPELIVRLGQAFATYVEGGTVVVGRDTRPSGDMVKHALFSGLMSGGSHIIDVGVVGTPTASMMIQDLRADGGIVISASHNPAEWNALKFFTSTGMYLNGAQARNLLDIYYSGDFRRVHWNEIREARFDSSAVDRHLRKVLDCVDVKALRKRRFRVGLDCANGAGGELALRFLMEIGAEIETIYCTPDGHFPRDPEPTAKNVTALCELVTKTNCDIGFAQDADADRVAFVAETGEYIGEEYTLCLAAQYVLAKRPGPVVTNLSSSRMIEDVAKQYGCEVVRTPVGEVNVAEKMYEINSPIGGEGNGGVIDPAVHCGREALTGMAYMLQLMLESGKTVSQLANSIPKYVMVKEKAACSRRQIAALLKRLEEETHDNIDTQDGIKLNFDDAWVHIRPSNTEPIVRIYAEARDESTAHQYVDKYMSLVKSICSDE